MDGLGLLVSTGLLHIFEAQCNRQIDHWRSLLLEGVTNLWLLISVRLLLPNPYAAGALFGEYKMMQKKIYENMKNDWNPSTWALILEYLSRAIQWIPTWQSFDYFQKSLLPCALDKGNLSIGSFLSEWVTNLWHLIPVRFLPQPLREDMAICPPDTSDEVRYSSAARPICHGRASCQNGSLTYGILFLWDFCLSLLERIWQFDVLLTPVMK